MINKRIQSSLNFNRIIYGTLIFISALHFFVLDDLTSGVITLLLALAFDPFNIQQTWADRPLWQRIWLLLHLIIGIAVLLFSMLQKIWFQ